MHNQKKNYVIVIPAYKPKEILLDIVDNLYKCFTHIIVVDDGSGKEYSAFFEKIGNRAVVLRHYVNLGKGRALKTAFNEVLHIMERDSMVGGWLQLMQMANIW